MATFKPVVRTQRKDGFYKVYIRMVHKIKPNYISTDKLVTKQHVNKDGNITYIDQTLKNVSASCEFYYNGEESLKTCLDKAIEILGMVRLTFIKTMRSFD